MFVYPDDKQSIDRNFTEEESEILIEPVSSGMDKSLLNIIILGISFLFIFSTFMTSSIALPNIVSEINKNHKDAWGGKTWNAYLSLSVLYFVFSFANWFAPPIVALLGPKYSLFFSALTYCFYIAIFLYPLSFGLILASIIMGFGASVIWTAQSTFLTINSTSKNITRNNGLFWAIFQGNLLIGNAFFYFALRGKIEITEDIRVLIFSILLATVLIGTFMLLFLRNVHISDVIVTSPLQAMCSSFRLMKSNTMLLICLTSFYLGIELSFFSGIYSSTLARIEHFGPDRQKYIGISGILIGIGEMLAGSFFIVFHKKKSTFGTGPVILAAFFIHAITFTAIYLNIPFDAVHQTTSRPAIIPTSLILALACSFFLGFADACYNTQLYSVIGRIYYNNSAPAFAIFKFIQSSAAAMAFFYSDYILLDTHVYILITCEIIGTIAFVYIIKQNPETLESAKQEDPLPSTVTSTTNSIVELNN